MITVTATATEMQNNFGRYLSLVMSGQEIIVTKNCREVVRFIPKAPGGIAGRCCVMTYRRFYTIRRRRGGPGGC